MSPADLDRLEQRAWRALHRKDDKLAARLFARLTRLRAAQDKKPRPVILKRSALASYTSLGLLLGGAAVGGGALWLYLDASAAKETLYGRFKQRDEQGLITGITHTDAVADASVIEIEETISALIGTAAILSASVGLIMALTNRGEVDNSDVDNNDEGSRNSADDGPNAPTISLGLGTLSLSWGF